LGYIFNFNLKIFLILTGTKNLRTSVKAYAIRACASAGGAKAVIST